MIFFIHLQFIDKNRETKQNDTTQYNNINDHNSFLGFLFCYHSKSFVSAIIIHSL